jgi:hypothetical protein
VGEQRRALDRIDRQGKRHGLGKAHHARPRARRAHPGTEAERVEPGGFGVAPRIVGIHAVREGAQLHLQASEVVDVGRVHPGREMPDADPLVGAPGVRKDERGVAGLEREAQLGHELGVGVLPFGGQLAPQLHGPPVRQPLLLDPAADSRARLQQDDVGSRAGQVARGGETGQAGADHHDVVS